MLSLFVTLLVLSVPVHMGQVFSWQKPVVLESEARDGYVCELIEYQVSRKEKVKAYLLVPDGAGKKDRRAGLVLLHDHGARFDIGKEKLVKPMASAPENIRLSAEEWSQSGFDGVFFGDELAKKGFVVIVPDALYWGSRSTEECQKWSRMKFCGEDGDIAALKNLVYEGQRTVYDRLYAEGEIWAEKTLREDATAVKILKKLPCVDRKRIGAFGWSMGAHRCWLLAAFCKDVKTGVALCWMTLKETCDNPPKASDFSMMIPEFRDNYDFPDIARWLAPKPFFFLNGNTDKLFPLAQSKQAFDMMQEIYSRKGASGLLRTEFFDGPHHCGLKEQAAIAEYLGSVLSQPLP